jgi:pentalenene oxygenase
MLMAAVAEPPRALEAAWYLLARSPDADARLHEEVTKGAAGPAPGGAEAPRGGTEAAGSGQGAARLPYLEAVVKETLRLFPPVRHIDRRPVAPKTIGDRSVGTAENVIVSPVVLHREPALYPEPDRFRPERWLGAGQAAGRTRGAYLPFGAGRHACLGAALGRTVVSVTLASVAREWRLGLQAPERADPRRTAIEFRLERR